MPIENLVSLPGPLAKALSQLDPATIQHAAEIIIESGTNPELRNQWHWTADGPIYNLEQIPCVTCGSDRGGQEDAFLYLARGKDNIIFKNIEEATRQLINNHNYVPKTEKELADLEAAISSEDTLKARLTDLNLESQDGEWSSFEFDTENYKEESNNTQIAVIERLYGEEGVKVLRENGIRKSRIYTLTSNYVKEHAGKDSALARAGGLYYFDDGSDFGADGWSVGYSVVFLRGVPRGEVAEGVAQKFPAELEKIKTALDSRSPFEYNGQLYVPVADGIKVSK